MGCETNSSRVWSQTSVLLFPSWTRNLARVLVFANLNAVSEIGLETYLFQQQYCHAVTLKHSQKRALLMKKRVCSRWG